MMNRREALGRLGGLLGAGIVTLGGSSAEAETTATATAAPATTADGSLTIAHITDVHIIDKYDAEEWVSKTLHQIQSHPSKPQLILNTGDCIMDSLRQDKKTTEHLWDVWNTTFKRENSLPIYHCLGNHDVWGGKLKLKTPFKSDPLFGKAMALEKLGMDKLYYSFDVGPWHFIMLDSVFPTKTEQDFSWIGKLDDAQMKWLKADLEATPKDRPVLIGSHLSIMQVCTMNSLKPDADLAYKLTPNIMISDAHELINLFKKHPNVKLCLSGHIHNLDRIQLNYTTYICDGSVCGGKWRGVNPMAPQGFSITTLHPDGSFDYKYETIGWKAKKA